MSTVGIAAPSASILSEVDKPKQRLVGYGIVKQVLTGDTIVILGAQKKEKKLMINGITAPKLATNKTSTDEPYAFISKEYLKDLILGKQVQYTVSNSIENSNAVFADVTFNDMDLAELLVENGYAKVNLPKNENGLKARSNLIQLQNTAIKRGMGIHKPLNKGQTGPIRKINFSPDVNALFKKYKNTPLTGIVDKVIDGSTFRIELLDTNVPSNYEHTVIVLNLSGISCPRFPVNNDKDKNTKQVIPPYANEAKEVSESRLIQRTVKVILQSIDKAGNLFGTIDYVKGNISIKLLELGLARYIKWTANQLKENDRIQLETAYQTAVSSRIGLYSDGKITSENESKVEYDAIVTQILSGDQIVINYKNEDIKINLSSISAPRSKGIKLEPYAYESKEYVRKLLINKKVHIIVDNTVVDKDNNKRIYATVLLNNKSIANELVLNGFAEVINYSKDMERANDYVTLVQSEYTAKLNKKGIWSDKSSASLIIDLTQLSITDKKNKNKNNKDENTTNKKEENNKKDKKAMKGNNERALLLLPKLTATTLPAVLEHVLTPTLLKVYVPSLQSIIGVNLAGINSVQANKEDKDKNVIYNNAIQFLRKYTQQDITLNVISLGRNDFFIGNILVNKVNLAVSLVQEGYASVLPFSANKNTYMKDLYNAEKIAKKNRVNIWIDYDEEKEKAELEKLKAETQANLGNNIIVHEGVNYIKCIVTDVADPVHFYINNLDDKNVQLVKEKLASIDFTKPVENFTPEKGMICAALFQDDNKYYRVRIDNVNTKQNLYSVQFIDYGNVASTSLENLRPIPKELQTIPQLARPCTLTCIKPPLVNSEYYEPASNALAGMTAEQEFYARIDHSEYGGNSLLHVTLFKELGKEDDISVNQAMLREGWVRINKKPLRRLANIADELEADEAIARNKHYNIWEYGSYSSDVDE